MNYPIIEFEVKCQNWAWWGEGLRTIAQIEFERDRIALCKIFLHRERRGKTNGVVQWLLDELKNWCNQRKVKNIILGTIDSMHAAQRFYLTNGFRELLKTELPATFRLIPADNKFFKRNIP